RRAVGGEVAGLVVAAFLDDDDVEAGLGELRGDRRAAGARADHDDIGIDHGVAVDVVARVDARWPRAFEQSRACDRHQARPVFRATLRPWRSGSGARIWWSCRRMSSR